MRTKAVNVHQGMDLRLAVAAALALGGLCEGRRRTGEIVVRTHAGSVVHNNRRKDASRELVTLLKRTVRG